ncbi:autotransporter outer membrane beta-barrel domain-containing protein [Agrobacterium sp.]|uniref:autotransporter outer membrane beta-barrel domain-containing protein n=1 Tax=Agrobacterium sp. TaxID=361 RepID=UPI0028AB7611|nr:autotransporter outer membrane beta-barrel domain-containing protein [Agrobacterium sp.]
MQGQTYSVLVAYNQTTAGSYPYTVLLTFTGVGCVSIYLNSCSSMTEELKLQAAQQGVMLNDMQSRAVVGQLRQRMQTGGMDRTPTGSLVHAYASEAKNDYNDVFGFATAGNDTSGRWTAWADTGADGLRGNWNPDVRGYQASQQFGLDYRFANGWVAGAAVGASIFGSDFDNGGETSGNAYWISPYLGMQFDDWMVTLQTTYSYVDYNTFTIGTGINGDTHGQRFSGSVSVARQFDLGNAFYMIPEVTLSVGRERISDISALTSGNVNDPRFFSSKIGGELGYNLSNDSRVYGLAFAEYINTNADTATASLSTGYKAKDWSATLGGAVDVKLADRTSLSLEGRVRGLGSDTLIYGGNARLNINF